VKGVVTNMGWFDTSVRKSDEATVIIPNGKILNEVTINRSKALR
jgi:small-conductance mechanosensitive channel